MTLDQVQAKIKELEAQVITVQNTIYGTEEGRLTINALNKKLGELEDLEKTLKAEANG